MAPIRRRIARDGHGELIGVLSRSLEGMAASDRGHERFDEVSTKTTVAGLVLWRAALLGTGRRVRYERDMKERNVLRQSSELSELRGANEPLLFRRGGDVERTGSDYTSPRRRRMVARSAVESRLPFPLSVWQRRRPDNVVLERPLPQNRRLRGCGDSL
jgi:hypothetical protein